MSGERGPSYDPSWKEKHADATATPEEAVRTIRPGARVFIGTGCGQPQALVRALCGRAGDLVDTEIVHLLTLGEAPYADPKLARTFRVNSFFIADNVRTIIQEGLGDYTPIFLSDIPRLFDTGKMPLDAALIQGMRGHLHDDHGSAVLAQACESPVHVDDVRCRQPGRGERIRKSPA